MNLDLNTYFMDIDANLITDITNITSTNASAFSYIEMPGGNRTLLNYITSFGVNGTSTNVGTGQWDTSFSGDLSYAASPIANNNYFTQYNRVRIIDGDGDGNPNDWAVFNFGPNNGSKDFYGNRNNNAYFGGESTSGQNSASGGKGGTATLTTGYVWGFSVTSS